MSQPKLLTNLAIALFTAAGVVFSGVVFWKGGLSPLFWAVLAFCSVLGAGLSRPLSTRFDDHGVSQVALTGRTTVAWSEIRELREEPFAFVLVSPHGSLRIPTWLFAEAAQVSKYVRSRAVGLRGEHAT